MNYYQTLKTLAVAIFMGCSVLSTQAQIYVDAAATGAKNGSSWDDAYTDLQAALDVAADNAEIRVASGTYTPTAAPDGSTNNRNKAFHFNKNLVLKGSYNTADTQDFTNPSILSGDFNDDDEISGSGSTLSITGNSENAYHVLITVNLTSAAQIEGFLITGGHANGNGATLSYSGQNIYNDSGAGMYHHASSPSIVNMVFSGNSTDFGGSGVYNDSSSPSIVNTVFSGNITADSGGGMYNTSSSSPSMVNTVFSGNNSSYGGGIYNLNSSPSMVNTVFSGNNSSYGGGMYNSSSSPSIVNSTFSRNKATTSGGGGGIRNSSSSTPTIYNTVFYGNGSDITNKSSSSTIGGSSFSEHNTPTGFTVLTADPFLDSENPKGADGVWFTEDDGLQPKIGSPIIDAGDVTKLPSDTSDFDKDEDVIEAIPIDIIGRSRELGVSVDAGAYEYESTTVLSLKDRDSSSLDIYSTGYKTLVIHGVFNAKTTANVYSLQGKLVASKVFNKFSTSNSIDVSMLSTGIYIVKMYNAKHQVHTKKLFIQ